MAKNLIESNDIKIEEVSGTNNIQLFLNNITEVTGQVTVLGTDTNGYTYIDLPDGYNLTNSVVLYHYYISGTGAKVNTPTIGTTILIDDNVSKVYFYLGLSAAIGIDRTYNVGVGLLKKE